MLRLQEAERGRVSRELHDGVGQSLTALKMQLALMEAASYMDISEGQLAAMWDEVRALTERARAVFRGEKVEEQTLVVHTSRPSGASLRAVARARNSIRGSSSPSMPSLSGPARRYNAACH